MPTTNGNLTKARIKDLIESASNKAYGISASELTSSQLYKCVASVVRDMLLEKRTAFNRQYKARDRVSKTTFSTWNWKSFLRKH